VRDALGAGADADDDGLLVYVAVEPSGCRAGVVLSAAPGFPDDVLDQLVAKRVVEDGMQPLIAECDLDHALLVGLGRIVTAITVLGPGSGGNADGSEAGPPFPEPIDGVRVYDHAGAFRAETIAVVAKTIAAIEDRTGAQVVVYSQVVESGRSTEEADADARSLMDQWGVGRKGFDDGLVILFDLYPGLDHGQVILYGGPGYRAAFLDNADKQRIYEEDMLPRLRAGDMDGALLVAIDRIDANATPEHAQTLETARQVNAVVGLVGGPLVALGLIGTAAWAWLRYGRDPVYLDDPSIHMAGPPEALTPAAAVFVLNGGPSRRALTTALLDLASRGVISFREEKHLLGIQKKVGIETRPAEPDPATAARQARNRARDLGPAEALVERRLGALDQDDAGYVEPDDLPAFAAAVPAFDKALEREVVARGWFAEPPSKAIARWTGRAALAGLLGGAGIWAGASLPSSGLLLVGVGAVVGAVVMFVIGLSMPAVSLPGAMIRAMLAAYRRTLKKTMDGARSMDQVVEESRLTWLETPDQAVVWGTALGLGAEIETVLGRSLEDAQEGRVAAGSVYLPAWYGSSAGGGTAFASDGDFAGASAGSGGIFSSSAIPDFGGMMSALGSIGSAPGSSGSGGGGGGGFGGGGSGGGGGGSGGGF
ncbi:MAG TPA: TPM domain-containing protein, partial [Candidatus Limnocylindrales bacterium]|nr:TPM domain-containing protein [Candidatus Limnocylindrales bacterium]